MKLIYLNPAKRWPAFDYPFVAAMPLLRSYRPRRELMDFIKWNS